MTETRIRRFVALPELTTCSLELISHAPGEYVLQSRWAAKPDFVASKPEIR